MPTALPMTKVANPKQGSCAWCITPEFWAAQSHPPWVTGMRLVTLMAPVSGCSQPAQRAAARCWEAAKPRSRDTPGRGKGHLERAGRRTLQGRAARAACLASAAKPTGVPGRSTSSSPSSAGGTDLWRFPVSGVPPIQQVPLMELALAGRAQIRGMRSWDLWDFCVSLLVFVPLLSVRTQAGHRARPSWQSSCSGARLASGAGAAIKLITGWQRAVGGRREGREGN